MKPSHSSYEKIARAGRDSAEYREGYEEARRAFMIGQAVRERRLELGLSQTETATRAGMTQPALSRLEAGGAVPTIPGARAPRHRPQCGPTRDPHPARGLTAAVACLSG